MFGKFNRNMVGSLDVHLVQINRPEIAHPEKHSGHPPEQAAKSRERQEAGKGSVRNHP